MADSGEEHASKRRRVDGEKVDLTKRDEQRSSLPASSGSQTAASTGWLWRCQPFYLNAIVDYGRAGGANEGCLSIRDIIEGESGQVQELLLANFMIDLDWMVSECPVMRKMQRITILTGEGSALDQSAGRLRKTGPRVEVYRPPLPIAFGSFHAKMILLTFNDRIRVCIHTANFIYPDWWRKNQAIYVQDFPRKQQQQGSQPSTDMEDMEDQLVAFLRATTKAGDWCDKIRQFDYSTAIGKIVASVPGAHKGSDINRWGHMRLRDVLSSQPDPQNLQDFHLVCQFSSLGSLSDKWLLEEFAGTMVSSSSHRRPARPSVPMHIVLPTVQQVRTSIEGWAAGSSIPIPSKNLKPFLQPMLHKWGTHTNTSRAGASSTSACPSVPHPPGRSNAMPHIKTFLKYGYRKDDTDRSPELAWAFLGSHNLSKAAWGELQKNNSQLSIRSYELGVVVSPSTLQQLSPLLPHPSLMTRSSGPSSSAAAAAASPPSPPTVRSFLWHKTSDDTTNAPLPRLYPATARPPKTPSGCRAIGVPVPYPLPPVAYVQVRDEPWCVDGKHSGVDDMGQTCPSQLTRFYGNGRADF
ncbi:unnamed protein product [Vitrella brassicaformis CCMP3155]|uniref:PLD phosphodiesterase domain-containing protein n=1 Tax=Vitrella brassicaformis (strain CCMP3155) TaxID=1169540 RepID=A0A0G4G5K9_VITBC|nr:unnamed protein product [Vitrella brassicaformis CCMP3155]|eukprot:CEM23753.1 unnamed protein product [Vitrella brassicaformis CCMP3155]